MTDSDVSPAMNPGISSAGIPSPRSTPSPRNTGSTSSRASSACQRTSAIGRPHQRRGSAGAIGGDGGIEPRVVEDLRHGGAEYPGGRIGHDAAHGSRPLRARGGAARRHARLHGLARVSGRGHVRAPDHRRRRSAPAPAGGRGAQGRGAQARAVEPLPARREVGRGADQPRLRAHRRDHRPLPRPGARGDQLRGAGHREHGGADDVRHPRAAGASGSCRCSRARSAPASR